MHSQELSLSVLLTHLVKIHCFYSLWQLQEPWLSNQTYLGLGHEAFLREDVVAAAFNPSSKAMRPASNVETAGRFDSDARRFDSGARRFDTDDTSAIRTDSGEIRSPRGQQPARLARRGAWGEDTITRSVIGESLIRQLTFDVKFPPYT